MPKSNIIRDIEKIADRISKRNLRESKALIQLGTWIKTLEDENRILKQRLNLVEIRVKKLNAYGPTPLTNKEADIDRKRQEENQNRLTAGKLKQFRIGKKLTQGAMAALLNVKVPKYARWENGQSIMTSGVETLIMELKQLKAKELRSKLQHLGFYQATGKKTKTLKGQEVSPALKTTKVVSETLITNVQIRELRLKLGYTHSQMAALYSVKPKTYSNWEYNACRPPEDVAKKLQSLYIKHFPQPLSDPEKTRQPQKRKIRESEILPIAQMREKRLTLGLSYSQLAAKLGIKTSRYANWEVGIAKLPDEFAYKLLALYGENHKSSAFVQENNTKKTKEKVHVKQNNGLPIVSASEMQDIRKTYGLSRKQMAQVVGVQISQYQNWEDKNRQVPHQYTARVRELANQDASGRAEHIKAAGIEKATGRFDQKKEENK